MKSTNWDRVGCWAVDLNDLWYYKKENTLSVNGDGN